MVYCAEHSVCSHTGGELPPGISLTFNSHNSHVHRVRDLHLINDFMNIEAESAGCAWPCRVQAIYL
jgi:hypothetical protein